MDLALLRTFVTVAHTGSVTAAAADLHLSQASVSRHIQRLESDLGTPLFRRREGRALELTEAARRILEPAGDLVASADDGWERLRTLAAGRPSRLSVAVAPLTTSMPQAVEMLRVFRAGHPEVDVRLVEHTSTEEVLRGLRNGELDLAIRPLRDDVSAPDFEAVALAPMRLYVILRRDHPLADRPELRVADIAGERFLFRVDSDPLRDFAVACAQAGVAPDIAHRVSDQMAAISILAAGDAITVGWASPGPAPGPLAQAFRLIPLDVAEPRASLAAFWWRKRPPDEHARDLIEHARRVIVLRSDEPIQK